MTREERKKETYEHRMRLAFEYERATGAGICDAYQIGYPSKERYGDTEWSYVVRDRDLNPRKTFDCLFRRQSLALFNTEGTGAKYLVIDIDVHVGGRVNHFGWSRERAERLKLRRLKRVATEERGSPVSYSEARRAFVARKVGPICEELRARYGDQVMIESSKWGVHAVFLLDGYVKPDEAHELGHRVLAAIGRHEGFQEDDDRIALEIFPKKNGIGCRMPLTGPARLLGRDLSRPKYFRRAKSLDVQELLLLRPLVARQEGSRLPERALTPMTAPGRPCESIQGEDKVLRVPRVLDDDLVRALVARPLAGDAFARVCEYLVRKGVPDDASRGAAGKLVALLLYAGVDPEDVTQGLVNFFKAEHHRSTRCNSDRRDRLGWTVRWEVRRGVELEARGLVRFGGVKRKDLLALADEIMSYNASPPRRKAA